VNGLAIVSLGVAWCDSYTAALSRAAVWARDDLFLWVGT